jgi:hypothetical protein
VSILPDEPVGNWSVKPLRLKLLPGGALVLRAEEEAEELAMELLLEEAMLEDDELATELLLDEATLEDEELALELLLDEAMLEDEELALELLLDEATLEDEELAMELLLDETELELLEVAMGLPATRKVQVCPLMVQPDRFAGLNVPLAVKPKVTVPPALIAPLYERLPKV